MWQVERKSLFMSYKEKLTKFMIPIFEEILQLLCFEMLLEKQQSYQSHEGLEPWVDFESQAFF